VAFAALVDRDLQPRVRKAVSRAVLRVSGSQVEHLEDVGVGRNVTEVPVDSPLRSFSPLLSGPVERRGVLLREDMGRADLHTQLLGQRVDDRDTDSVQPPETCTAPSRTSRRVQDVRTTSTPVCPPSPSGNRDADRRRLRDGFVGGSSRDFRAEAARASSTVVDDLVDKMMQAITPVDRCTSPGACGPPRGPRGGYVLGVVAGEPTSTVVYAAFPVFSCELFLRVAMPPMT